MESCRLLHSAATIGRGSAAVNVTVSANCSLRFRKFSAVQCAKRAAPARPGQGFGAKAPPRTSTDAGVLLKRSELLYDQLIDKNYVDGKAREFVVCVRQRCGEPKLLDDWLPVAELALVSELDAAEIVPRALQALCREIAECAAKKLIVLRQIPRSNLEYAYEPAGDFYDFVLGSLGTNTQQQQQERKSECPYKTLGLERGSSTSQVRKAYRTLAAKLHPDVNPGSSDEAYKKVVAAYERIRLTGFTASQDYGYAGLGGNSRQGFSSPVTIDSSLKEPLKDVQFAVRQMDSDIVLLFSARSLAK